jgi:hypothetical protein
MFRVKLTVSDLRRVFSIVALEFAFRINSHSGRVGEGFFLAPSWKRIDCRRLRFPVRVRLRRAF